MKLREISASLGLKLLTRELDSQQDVEVTTGHASDLLSDVLSNAPSGSVIVTIQAHLNVVAVALHARAAAVILAAARSVDPEVIERAAEEKVPLFSSDASTFDVVGRLYEIGIRGGRS